MMDGPRVAPVTSRADTLPTVRLQYVLVTKRTIGGRALSHEAPGSRPPSVQRWFKCSSLASCVWGRNRNLTDDARMRVHIHHRGVPAAVPRRDVGKARSSDAPESTGRMRVPEHVERWPHPLDREAEIITTNIVDS